MCFSNCLSGNGGMKLGGDNLFKRVSASLSCQISSNRTESIVEPWKAWFTFRSPWTNPFQMCLSPVPKNISMMDWQDCLYLCFFRTKTYRADFFNAVYLRRSLTCTLGLTNNLIDGGQPRAKPHLRKAKPNHVLKIVFSPRLATIYQSHWLTQ